MSKNKILNQAGKLFNHAKFFVKKNSPTILLVTGIGSGIAGTIFACKATLKASPKVEKAKQDLDEIQKNLEDETKAEYTKAEAKKDSRAVILNTAKEVGKDFLPAFALCTTGAACVCGGYGILNSRNAGLMTAVAGLTTQLKDLDARGEKALGKEEWKKIKYGLREEQKETGETVVDPATGEEASEKEKILVPDEGNDVIGIYQAVYSEETSKYWDKEGLGENAAFLKMKEAYWNNTLKSREKPVVFLNEVRMDIGLDPIPEGQFVGWVYNPKDPYHRGDNFISFGVDWDGDALKEYYRGNEPVIYLTFNGDGCVYESLK